NFQLWNADDFEHRLKPAKLLNIIKLSEEKLGIEDAEIEVEYQSNTIGKYALASDGTNFILQNKTTACLALDACGIPSEIAKKKIKCIQIGKMSLLLKEKIFICKTKQTPV